MQQPDLIIKPFADDATPDSIDSIPLERDPTDPLEKASWREGFPHITMIPKFAGGLPPRGQDFNGILNALSKHAAFAGSGGQYKFTQPWIDENGGYDKGDCLLNDALDTAYISTKDNNTTNFNTTTNGDWIAFAGASKADGSLQIKAGVGLTGGGAISTNPTLTVKYGDTAGSAAQGNDSRLSNAREWTADTVSQAEAEAGTATTRRAWTAQRVGQAIDALGLKIGTTETTAAAGNDSRIVNAVPNTRSITAGTGLSGGGNLTANRTLSVNYGTTAGTAAQGNDSRLSNAREWTADTVSQAEAEAGTATTRRAWTAQRVQQAVVALFNGVSGALGRTILSRTTAAQVRGDIGLGTAATANVTTSATDTTAGRVLKVGDLGWGAVNAPGENYNNVDLITTAGFYSARGAAVGGAGNSDGGLFVMVGRNDTKQIGWDTATGLRFRGNDDPASSPEGWSPWYEFIHSGNLRQSTGQSTTYPMSQKAVTDAIESAGPTVVQGTGQSTTAVMSQKAVSGQLFGVGQTWQDVSTTRSAGAIYTNTSGRTIAVTLSWGAAARDLQVRASDSSAWVTVLTGTSGSSNELTTIVSANHSYRLEGGSVTALRWVELR